MGNVFGIWNRDVEEEDGAARAKGNFKAKRRVVKAVPVHVKTLTSFRRPME